MVSCFHDKFSELSIWNKSNSTIMNLLLYRYKVWGYDRLIKKYLYLKQYYENYD